MKIGRLIAILEDWSRWMKQDSHKLGYPNKTSYLSSGGESTVDVFEHMIDEADKENVKIINACIDSLPINQKKAIYYRWLKGNKPIFYERNFDLAMDNLLTIVGKRIYA
jgi:hypothetical protein|tara:strand:- start:1473 stop:1799 length:327 start_codon:yes stop_codon:yes gene_type:complete